MKPQRMGKVGLVPPALDINLSQEDEQSESENRFNVVLEPNGEELGSEGFKSLGDVLGVVHKNEVIFYSTFFGAPKTSEFGLFKILSKIILT